jgi:hypothetical protein
LTQRNEKLQKQKEKEKEKDNVRPPIETLENFDWRAVEPLQLRPFKSTFHVTMGMACFPTFPWELSG